MELVVEKGVPLPAQRSSQTGYGLMETLRRMAVGDSFVMPKDKRNGVYMLAKAAGVQIAVRSEGIKADTVRVWRTA